MTRPTTPLPALLPAPLPTLLLALLLQQATAAHAGVVAVAVAANFSTTLAALAPGFTAATGHTLRVSAGSTGKLASQIVAGAPFDVLLAADDDTPQKLIGSGHAVAGSQITYATGELVLWSAQPGLVDPQGAVLASGRFNKLAIANPKLAPYGLAALQVLQAKGLHNTLAPKLVTGDSIAQAYQFIVTGNAALGFVALSQVLQPGQPIAGSHWRVPANLYSTIRQDAVLLQPAAQQPAAAALLAYLQTAAAKALIQQHGYRP